ncbi:MAG TPA: hypothetical protein VMT24_09435, partial [Aggregatilineaceae bacterium]|nr:hypothetical protein [Aggregatilineaceae bacterium]
SFGYQLDTISVSPLLTNIAPGQVFYIGRSVPVPAGFANTQRWVWFETSSDAPRFTGYFDLPTTIDFQGEEGQGVYVWRGTATNNTGQTLIFPVVDVLLAESGGEPVGLTHAVVTTSNPNGSWMAGEVATYEAVFRFVAADMSDVTQVTVSATGYTVN